MLHTKFHQNLILKSFYHICHFYVRGGHLGHVTQIPLTNFCSPNLWRLRIKFDFDWPSDLGEEDV